MTDGTDATITPCIVDCASVLSPDARLLRAVQAIAGVAEARDDKASLVQAPVDGGAHDVHVGV